MPPLFEQPWHIARAAEYDFYHSTYIPGHGLVEGQRDLRADVDEYLSQELNKD